MKAKQVRAQCTQELRLEAVRQVCEGHAIAVVAKVLGTPKASFGNWVRQAAKGAFSGAGGEDKAAKVTHEQMEIALLRPEVAWLRMERDVAKKLRCTSRSTRCEVRLVSPNEAAVPGERLLRRAEGQR